jgi:hypothetical protein
MLNNLTKSKKKEAQPFNEPVIIEKENSKQLAEILQKLSENAVTHKEILKSVRFIKNYFLWQSTYSFLKLVILLSVIVLGFISWPTIASYLLKFYG